MSNGFIYFISDNNGHIKIGVTEDVTRRMQQLQTGNAMELSLIHSIRMNSMSDAYDLETILHRTFDEYQVKNEWYRGDVVMRMLRHNWIDIGGYRFRGIGFDIGKLKLFAALMTFVVIVLNYLN